MYSQTWANSHLLIAPTCLLRPSFWGPVLNHYSIKWPLNNDHLSTTATIFGCQGWLLYTGLTVIRLSPQQFRRKSQGVRKGMFSSSLFRSTLKLCGIFSAIFPLRYRNESIRKTGFPGSGKLARLTIEGRLPMSRTWSGERRAGRLFALNGKPEIKCGNTSFDLMFLQCVSGI